MLIKSTTSESSCGHAHGHPHEDLWPKPLSNEALTGLAGEIIDAIEPQTEADPAAVLLQFLAAFGNVVGRKPHFVVEADRHGTNLYVVIVGNTSSGRKGTSWGYVRSLFEQADTKGISQKPFSPPAAWKDRIETGLSSGEGVIWAVRDPIPSTKPGGQNDPGVSDKRRIVVETEFASCLRTMAREGNTLSPVLRNAWDDGNLQILSKNSPARATGAHISIIGHIGRPELRRYLNEIEMGNGFANRILWCCSRRSKKLPEGGKILTHVWAPLIDRLKLTVEVADGVNEMKLNDAAKEVWGQSYPKLSNEQYGLFGAITARAAAQVRRLGCIYALLDLSTVVDVGHLRAAIAVWEYCESSVRFIFGDAVGDSVADKILLALRKAPGGLTRTVINHELFTKNMSCDRIDLALAMLRESGLAYSETQPTGGHPIERWFTVKGTTKTN